MGELLLSMIVMGGLYSLSKLMWIEGTLLQAPISALLS